MHRIIFMAGTIIASSFGFALVGLVLREAIKNARTQWATRDVSLSDLPSLDTPVIDWEIAVRGYDSPEVEKDDRSARARYSGNTGRVE